MDNGTGHASARDLAELRSHHEDLKARFEDDHEIVKRLDKADVRDGEILERIEGKVDQLLAIESRVRDLETARAERRGRWWAVTGIAVVLVGLVASVVGALITDALKSRPPENAPNGDHHRSTDGDPLPPWR